MNAAESIILRAALRQERIDRQQLMKTKDTSITNCHIFVMTNNMQSKYYSTKLFQKRFRTLDVAGKKNIYLQSKCERNSEDYKIFYLAPSSMCVHMHVYNSSALSL